MSLYKKILDGIVKVVSELLILLVIGIVLIMLYELLLRNVFNSSFRASTELCGFLFMWMAFLGVIVVYHRQVMISLDFVSSRLNGIPGRLVYVLQKAAGLVLGVIMILAYKALYPVASTSFFSSMRFLSKNWHFLPMALAGGFMILQSVYDLLAMVVPGQKGEKPAVGSPDHPETEVSWETAEEAGTLEGKE